jgi:outer membrane receptor protein involved in Fe transport
MLIAPFWHLPNPDLDPEIINTFEVSSGYYLNDNIGIFMDAYYNKATDLVIIEVDTTLSFQGIEVDEANIPINKGEGETYGGTFRANAKYQIGDMELGGYGAYSYSDGEIEGEPIPYSAKHTIKAGIDAKIWKITGSLRGIYRTESKHSLVFDENGDPVTNDSFLLLNLFLKGSIIENEKFGLEIYTKINNLLNTKYYNVPLGQDELFNKSPQDPIRILGGVIIRI